MKRDIHRKKKYGHEKRDKSQSSYCWSWWAWKVMVWEGMHMILSTRDRFKYCVGVGKTKNKSTGKERGGPLCTVVWKKMDISSASAGSFTIKAAWSTTATCTTSMGSWIKYTCAVPIGCYSFEFWEWTSQTRSKNFKNKSKRFGSCFPYEIRD